MFTVFLVLAGIAALIAIPVGISKGNKQFEEMQLRQQTHDYFLEQQLRRELAARQAELARLEAEKREQENEDNN